MGMLRKGNLKNFEEERERLRESMPAEDIEAKSRGRLNFRSKGRAGKLQETAKVKVGLKV